MPDEVIERVNFLGQDQPELITFADRHGHPIGDQDPDIPGVPGDNAAADDGDDDDNIPGVPVDNVELPGVYQGDNNEDQALPDIFEVDNDDQHPAEIPEPEFDMNEPNNILHAEPQLVEAQPENAAAPAVPVAEELVPPAANAPRRSSRVRRPDRRYIPAMQGNRYHYAAAQIAKGMLYPDAHMFVQEDFYRFDIDVIEHVMTQLSLKAALKEWGEDAKIAACAEVRQLHWRKTFQPVHRRDLTPTQ
jgi:hypothetical protein